MCFATINKGNPFSSYPQSKPLGTELQTPRASSFLNYEAPASELGFSTLAGTEQCREGRMRSLTCSALGKHVQIVPASQSKLVSSRQLSSASVLRTWNVAQHWAERALVIASTISFRTISGRVPAPCFATNLQGRETQSPHAFVSRHQLLSRSRYNAYLSGVTSQKRHSSGCCLAQVLGFRALVHNT